MCTTSFTVKLLGFDATSKVKLIKEIKANVADMNLVQVSYSLSYVYDLIHRQTTRF